VVLEDKIEAMIRPSIEALGFDLWGIEYLPAGKHSILRIYIDKSEGVTVEDCAEASYQVGAVLEVEDPISNAYHLEVSSPGLDRQLFKFEQYQAYQNEILQIRTHESILGRRKFKGKVKSLSVDSVALEVDGEIYEIPFEAIEKAKVVPQFEKGLKKGAIAT